jgi:HAE1 family hydrophobic/amphiphilic exporter-1
MISNSGVCVVGKFAWMAALLWAAGCQEPSTSIDQAQVSRYEERMAGEAFEPAANLTQIDARSPVNLVGQIPASDATLDATVWLHLPDPSVAQEVLAKRQEVTKYGEDSIRRDYELVYTQTLARIKEIERTDKVRLTLAETLRRALANNYQIKVDGYAPAISTAQIVQAEAAFDAAFFSNQLSGGGVSRNNTDRPPLRATISGSQVDTTIVSGGIRKLLATGATITLIQQMSRTDAGLVPDPAINPTWSQSFVAELRQPLLRNFGIDFNRAEINIRKQERLSNVEAFRAAVTDVLVKSEQAYWQLMFARRNVVINAEALAQAELTLHQIEARVGYDAIQADVYEGRGAVKDREAQYIESKNLVRNAEDQLLNLLNDPELPTSEGYEIIPVDNPTTVEVIRDRFQAVETALQSRPEIKQARYSVEIAKLNVGIAKNQALPQIDAIYRMTMNGLGANSDRAWDQMTSNDFTDQFVGIELQWSPGERRERAGIRLAALQQSQAVVRYKQSLDTVITECLAALRDVETNFEQIQTDYELVQAAAESLRTYQERRETMSPPEVNLTLQRQSNLATSRQRLLQDLAEFNQAIVVVERAKGTLLEYNNVHLAEQP